MPFARDSHHRHSIRLPGFNYATAGAYFVTICTHGRASLFGEVANGVMRLNDAGRMVNAWWSALPEKFEMVTIDAAIVMPNHFHGILFLVGVPPRGCPGLANGVECHCGRPHRAAPTLGDVIGWFKTMTTNTYINGVKQNDWPSFSGRLWQRNYYERVVRNDTELHEIREYITNNPQQWALDDENLAGML